MPHLLIDPASEQSSRLLDDAWSKPETFAFVSEKSGVPESWIREALARFPPAFQSGHFVLLTSGSTGRPKLVVGSRKRSEQLAVALHTLQEAEAVEQALGVLPLTYSYAFVNQWLWARQHQRRLTWTAGFARPEALLIALKSAQHTQLCLVRAHVPLLQNFFPSERFPGVIRLHFAGSRFPQEQLDFLRGLFPEAQIYNNYGCTEAMPRLCLRKAEDADTAQDVGRPLPGVTLKTNEAGELVFQSPFSAVAHADDAGFHAYAPDEWIPTGDLGSVEAGRCQIHGRVSDVFKRHGEKISLQLIQQTLAGAWTGSTAFYREEDPHHEPGYILVLSPHPTPEQARTLLQTLRQHYPRSHWPLRLESVDTLPYLPNNKVDAGALARLDGKKVHWYDRI